MNINKCRVRLSIIKAIVNRSNYDGKVSFQASSDKQLRLSLESATESETNNSSQSVESQKLENLPLA